MVSTKQAGIYAAQRTAFARRTTVGSFKTGVRDKLRMDPTRIEGDTLRKIRTALALEAGGR